MKRARVRRPWRRHVIAGRITRHLGLLGALMALLASGPVLTQQLPQPTAEQMQLLNSLPPAQRQEILRQYRQLQQQVQRGTAEQQAPELGDGISQFPEDDLAFDEPLEPIEEEPRLELNSTIVIEFNANEQRAGELTAAASAELDAFRDRLSAGNPYQLDIAGNIYLPGVPAIALAGLNVDEAAVRIDAEPQLRNLDIFVTFLPLEPVGVDALEPFGYDLFEGSRRAFTPYTNVPVPAEYVMGPGDSTNVQLFGNQNAEYVLVVSREGTINFPDIGPINVGGLTFAEMRELITQRVSEQMIGVRVSITLGELRSIRVFVVGDVERPGSYTVSGLSTITNALFVSRGVTEVGSLRKIELKRDGETVATLDLYNLLLRGDTSGDQRLLAGDVVFVPPVGDTVAVDGTVRRPAVYELNGESTVEELIELAGGLRPTADRTTVKLERIVPGRGISVRDINLDGTIGRATPVQNGDVISVPANVELLEQSVRLAGNVYQPGLYEWESGMRLTDLISSPDRVKPRSDLSYVLIRREIEAKVFIEAISTDLQQAWRQPDGPDDLELRPRDTVHVFNLDIGRSAVILPLLEELRAQAPANQPVAVARVGGQVRAPGEYPLEPGMRISDLIRAGGGLTESAYVLDAELTRYDVVGGAYRQTDFVTVNVDGIIRGDPGADLLVTSHDYFNVREVPQWRTQQTVQFLGEVRFPGVYPIRQGDTLSSVLSRAGGLTDHAFANGSVFLRQELAEREREQLQILASRVESDIAAISLSDTTSGDVITVGRSLVEQLRNSEPTGRLVIDLSETMSDSSQDIVLKNGDRLLVPEITQSVTVLGEVQYATSHLYDTTLDRDDYILRSGGLTSRADRSRIYVVRSNGEVIARSRSRWFSQSRTSDIEPGDTVVVPMDIDVGRRLSLWTSVTQIVYNLAIAAAAVNSF